MKPSKRALLAAALAAFWVGACHRAERTQAQGGVRRLVLPASAYQENRTDGPWLGITNEGLLVEGKSFWFSDAALSNWLESALAKSAPDAVLQLDIDRETFWVRLVQTLAAARRAGWKRLALLFDADARGLPAGRSHKPPALLVRLADEKDAETFTVQLPEMLPWQAAFVEVQRAAFAGRPLVLSVLPANPSFPTLPMK